MCNTRVFGNTVSTPGKETEEEPVPAQNDIVLELDLAETDQENEERIDIQSPPRQHKD